MRKSLFAFLAAAVAAALALAACDRNGASSTGTSADAPDAGGDSLRVLVFSKTGGYRHASIPEGVAAVEEIAKRLGYAADATEDSTRFAGDGLDGYAAVVFLSTTGDVLGPAGEAGFERFIRRGGGYVGVHAAADTEYDWPFYGQLVGRYFRQHPPHQRGRIHVVPDNGFEAATAGFGDSLTLFEEWYEYGPELAADLRYLYRLDTNTVDLRAWKGPSEMGAFHPLGWYHEHAGGRAFYTGIGHMEATFTRPDFRDHLRAGLRWAATGER